MGGRGLWKGVVTGKDIGKTLAISRNWHPFGKLFEAKPSISDANSNLFDGQSTNFYEKRKTTKKNKTNTTTKNKSKNKYTNVENHLKK